MYCFNSSISWASQILSVSRFLLNMLFLFDRTKVSQLPAQFQLGTRVAVAMELFTDDPELKVILQQCYVTPGEAMDSTPQFMLIEEK